MVNEQRLNTQNKNTKMKGRTFQDDLALLRVLKHLKYRQNFKSQRAMFLSLQFSKDGPCAPDKLVLLRVLERLKY